MTSICCRAASFPIKCKTLTLQHEPKALQRNQDFLLLKQSHCLNAEADLSLAVSARESDLQGGPVTLEGWHLGQCFSPAVQVECHLSAKNMPVSAAQLLFDRDLRPAFPDQENVFISSGAAIADDVIEAFYGAGKKQLVALYFLEIKTKKACKLSHHT